MKILRWYSRVIVKDFYCELDSPKMWSVVKLHRGESVIDECPKDIVYGMSKWIPNGHVLRDNYFVSGQIIVSKKLKDTLVKELASTHAVEFLPVAIEDHTKKIVSRDYFIMHPLGMVDCIDIKKSKGKYNPLKKEMLTSCKSLVLIPDSIPDGIRLFRPKHWGFNVMVTEDFARYLESQNFVGLWFPEAEGFNGISSPYNE